MIFHEHKTIYFHIGKAAGFAVEQLLRPDSRNVLETDRESLFGVDRSTGVFLQHASAHTVRELVGEKVFEDYYTFAVVRNPFSRLASVYYYLYDQHQKQFGDFENYILSLPKTLKNKILYKGSHHIPQTYYTHIDGQPACDHIAYFEHLPQSMDPVTQLLGIHTPLKKLNVNRNPNRPDKPVHKLFTPEMVRVVRKTFEKDFEFLGYSQDPKEMKPLSTQMDACNLRRVSTKKRSQISTAKKIPKILHQIWIGPDRIPSACQRWMEGWKDLHPNWEYRLWTDEDLPEMSTNSWDVYHKTETYAGKTDILCYEIIKQFGGLYVDVDFECYKPVDDLVKNTSFLGVWPVKGRICNGIFAASPHHPILQKTVKNLTPKPPPGNGPVWLDKNLKAYLAQTNQPNSVRIIKELTAFFPGYATAWPKNRFGKKIVRLSSRKHPFAKHHALKSWMPPEKRKNIKSFYTSDPAYNQIQMMKLLCLCARPTGHPALHEKLNKQAAGINSLEKLPYMAEQHGMAPLVYFHLREAGIEIPANVNRTLKGAYLTHRHANRERMVALKEIAVAYRKAGIEMLALKGAALANTIYPDIALRCMCDLDLMVADHKAEIARRALESLGFDIHKTASIQPKAFSHHFPPAIRDQNGVGVVVELHHHLYAISKLVPSVTLDKLLPDALPFDLDQTVVDTLGPEQMLWHSYIHAVGKLQLVEQFRLIHVADLVGIVEEYADVIDWQRLKKLSPQTYHAIIMLHLFTPWSEAVIKSLPFDTETSFSFKDFPHLPSAMGVSSRDRNAWIPRFFKDIILPPDWWVCFFQGNHPAKFNTISYRVVYPIRRLSAFFVNLTGFYVRKWYRKWHQGRKNRE